VPARGDSFRLQTPPGIRGRISGPRLECRVSSQSLPEVCYEAVSGLFDRPDSVVCGTAVARDYLHDKCKRVSEARARIIHPALFETLDQP